jgi:hypothetical protein
MSGCRAVLVPGVPALLPEHAGQVDAVAELRAACRGAVGDLVASTPSRVVVVTASCRPQDVARGLTAPPGRAVADHLLAEAGHTGEVVVGDTARPGDALLLVANGSACRSERAPGHLDQRAAGFDEALARTIREGAPPPQDQALAEELWCFDLGVFRELHAQVSGTPDVRYADDPYGVAYWVATWPEGKESS